MRVVTSKSELEALRIPTALGALVTDIAARMWPYKFVSHILESLLKDTKLKGTFNLQTLTPATSIEHHPNRKGQWIVSTPRGNIVAAKVIFATNAYTSHLIPSFAPLIVPVRGQMSALKPLPSVDGDKDRLKTSFGFMGEGLDDYLIQRPTSEGGHLMFGGGRQFGLSVGITDDSVIDDDTAKYLRSRLVDALGLPEGMMRCRSMESGRSPVVQEESFYPSCQHPPASLKPLDTIEKLNQALKCLEDTEETCPCPALHTYQFQLCLLEKLNFARLANTGVEQDAWNKQSERVSYNHTDPNEHMREVQAEVKRSCARLERRRQERLQQEPVDRQPQNTLESAMELVGLNIRLWKSTLANNAQMKDTHEAQRPAGHGGEIAQLIVTPRVASANDDSPALQDWKMQLRLLEHQNQKRLAMARAEARLRDQVGQSSVAQAFTPIGTMEKFNHDDIDEGMHDAPDNVPINTENNHALQDFQMQLMLLEQQNKKRLAMARAELSAAESHAAEKRNDEECKEMSDSPTDSEMEDVIEVYSSGTVARGSTGNESGSIAVGQDNDSIRVEGVPDSYLANSLPRVGKPAQQPVSQRYDGNVRPPKSPMLDDREAARRDTRAKLREDSSHLTPLQDWQMQLMLLEQQNKKRLSAAKAEQNALMAEHHCFRTPSSDVGMPALGPLETQPNLGRSGSMSGPKQARTHPSVISRPSFALPTRPKAPTAVSRANLSPNAPVEFQATHEWTGIMAFSRDDLPWVGPAPSPEDSGIYISAGYTGHGMPNAWLCGAAVSSMVRHVLAIESAAANCDPWFSQQARDLNGRLVGTGLEDQFMVAKHAVGLPKAYLISEERVRRAMEIDDVGVRDWAEMDRARRKREGRPVSGYA